MKQLNRTMLKEGLPGGIKGGSVEEFPVKVMQFGEGNFMRAFIDWMIDEMNQQGVFKGMVRMVQPIENGMADMINAQDGLYTLLLRGVQEGKVVEQQQVITCVKDCLNPYTAWQETIDCACGEDLRFVFSNTTEAGIAWLEEEYNAGICPKSFPAKLAVLLYERFKKFKGAPGKGLIIIPCELIDKNGKKLHEYIRRHAENWKLGSEFIQWLDSANHFVCTLVDRIVAGYPRNEIDQILAKLGYQDNLVNCGEIFHFFVIEGDAALAEEIPFHKVGLNVVWTEDQSPYRTRKVRFLNGAHTSSVLAAYLGGLDYVDEMMEDKVYGRFVENAIHNEVYHTVNLPEQEKSFFADSIIERFRNPFAGHQLISISLNSTSKWQVRVLPSLLDYVALKNELPKALAFSLAALICFYDAEQAADGNYYGYCRSNPYQVSDDADRVEFFASVWKSWKADKDTRKLADAILARSDFWDMDLNTVPGMTDFVTASINAIKTSGIRAAVKTMGAV